MFFACFFLSPFILSAILKDGGRLEGTNGQIVLCVYRIIEYLLQSWIYRFWSIVNL